MGGLRDILDGGEDDPRPLWRTRFDSVDAQIRHTSASPTPAALARLLRALADVLDGEDSC